LGYKLMATDEEVEDVTDWLRELAADFYGEDIAQLVQHLDRCLNCIGDYVEQ
jgi:hypothetical protein